jgi:hypothetical protein
MDERGDLSSHSKCILISSIDQIFTALLPIAVRVVIHLVALAILIDVVASVQSCVVTHMRRTLEVQGSSIDELGQLDATRDER